MLRFGGWTLCEISLLNKCCRSWWMGWKLYPDLSPTSWLCRIRSYLLASRYARLVWSCDAHPHAWNLIDAHNTCPWNGGRWHLCKILIFLFLCWWLSLHTPDFWFDRHHSGDTAQVPFDNCSLIFLYFDFGFWLYDCDLAIVSRIIVLQGLNLPVFFCIFIQLFQVLSL